MIKHFSTMRQFGYGKCICQGHTHTQRMQAEDPSHSVTLLTAHPAAAEQFLHSLTNESGFSSAFAQLGAVVPPTAL